jgi:ribonuclease HI
MLVMEQAINYIQKIHTYNIGKTTDVPITRPNSLAILKAMNMKSEVKADTIYTDSGITLDSLKNTNIHSALVEEIRQQLTTMNMQWNIQFCLVRPHAEIQGNETADTLAKEAATSTDTPEYYDKEPKSVIKSELEALSVAKW